MIPDGDSMVLTGGNHGAVTNVTRYNRTGLVEHLPNLVQGRSSHGCSSFLSDGAKVCVVSGFHNL